MPLKIYLFACIALLLSPGTSFAQAREDALWQPYFISPRTDTQQIDLSRNWELNHLDQPAALLRHLPKAGWVQVAHPTSVHWALYRAGKLPHPYVGLNSTAYEWAEQAVWYYRKRFEVPESALDTYSMLCFDGIDYTSRVWLNGEYMGYHEGMFGGPTIEVSEQLNIGGENELIVEVRAANYGMAESYEPRNPGKFIKPWEFSGGSGAEPWFTLGMWQGVRLAFLPNSHLERPHLVTEQIEEGNAHLRLRAEVFVAAHSLQYEYHPWDKDGYIGGTHYYNQSDYQAAEGSYRLEVEFYLDGKRAHTETFPLPLFTGRNWVNQSFQLPDPALWWPNGLGDQPIYEVRCQLYKSEKRLDVISFDFGVRTITQTYAGIQFSDVWNPWQFVVNDQKIFVKGINWMPADVLLDLPKEKYEWIIGLAKDAGIQLFRIWGAGLLETDAFYDVCDAMGIMVWQDFPIANYGTPAWPMDVWEAQVIQNICRIRNRASLAVYNGGNEFNPYGFGNSASIGILERNLKIWDPSRMFTRTSPDGGAIHTYPDMDPAWYVKQYKYANFISETGMHSITDPQGLYEIVDPDEFQDLGNMYSDEFVQGHPEFIHHFVEFNPVRVPRMLSRASHIDDMANPSLEAIAEASQVGAGEFYQLMAEQVQGNYPLTMGLMPWVFKRPWPVVAGIHLADGFGQPSAPYYFLKRTYENLHVMVELDRLLWKPGETLAITAKVLNLSKGTYLKKGQVSVRILDTDFEELGAFTAPMTIRAHPSVSELELGSYTLSAEYQNRFFLIVAELRDDQENLVSRSVYWPRTIPQMEDPEFYEAYVSKPVPWPTLSQGPWLKPIIAKTQTRLTAELLRSVDHTGSTDIQVRIKNIGKIPAFMVEIEIEGPKRLFRMDDNFFWIEPGEEQILNGTIKWREAINSVRAP